MRRLVVAALVLGASLLALLTLPSAFSLFGHAYSVGGGAVSAAPAAPATLTATPVRPPLTPGAASPAASPTATVIATAMSTQMPVSATATLTQPTKPPETTRTPTATPSPTATSSPTATATTTATPDPCLATDALLVFTPIREKIASVSRGLATLLLENRGAKGLASDVLLRFEVTRGAEHLKSLSVNGVAWREEAPYLIPAGELRPGAAFALDLVFELVPVTPAADAIALMNKDEAIELRFEVVRERCRPSANVGLTATVTLPVPKVAPQATRTPLPATPTPPLKVPAEIKPRDAAEQPVSLLE